MNKRSLAFGCLYFTALVASLNAPNGCGVFSLLFMWLIVSCTNFICMAIEFNGEQK